MKLQVFTIFQTGFSLQASGSTPEEIGKFCKKLIGLAWAFARVIQKSPRKFINSSFLRIFDSIQNLQYLNFGRVDQFKIARYVKFFIIFFH